MVDVRRQERARSRSAPALDRAHVVVAGVAHDVTLIDSSCKPREVVAYVHVAVHKPGIKVLPRGVHHLRAGGTATDVRAPDAVISLSTTLSGRSEPCRVASKAAPVTPRSRGHLHPRLCTEGPAPPLRRLRLLDFRLFVA